MDRFRLAHIWSAKIVYQLSTMESRINLPYAVSQGLDET